MSGGDDPDGCEGIEGLLNDPKTCAFYLTDALQTGDERTIADAVRDVGRANGSNIDPLNSSMKMTLAELLSVLENAGVRLTAEPDDSTKA